MPNCGMYNIDNPEKVKNFNNHSIKDLLLNNLVLVGKLVIINNDIRTVDVNLIKTTVGVIYALNVNANDVNVLVCFTFVCYRVLSQ